MSFEKKVEEMDSIELGEYWYAEVLGENNRYFWRIASIALLTIKGADTII